MRFLAACAYLVLAISAGCSIKRVALDRIGDAVAGDSRVYAGDDDPALVRDASPFALKTLESLLAETPNHRGLLLAACSGFTQYAHAFLQDEADYVEAKDPAQAAELRARAKKLYLRARAYGFRGLETALPGFQARLRADPAAALAKAGKDQVPFLYWTAASWAAAFALDLSDASLAVDQGLVEKMMARALALDERWENGAIHEFFVAWEAGHAQAGGSMAAARRHYESAYRLSGGVRASLHVAAAEDLALPAQDRSAFETQIKAALAIDPDKDPDHRLANLVAQRRARWLQSRTSELFLEEPPSQEPHP